MVRESGDTSAAANVETSDHAAPPVPPTRATSARGLLVLVPLCARRNPGPDGAALRGPRGRSHVVELEHFAEDAILGRRDGATRLDVV